MASESVEDCDEFDLYHVDFTTASEWEVFIARIEEILQQWKLNNKKPHLNKENLSSATWESQTENVTFADFEFNITRHYTKGTETDSIEEKKNPMPDALEEMMCTDQDFLVAPAQLGDEGVLVTWYGLSDFVTLTPAKGTLSSESKLKVLLSSLCMAVNNVGCEVPTFVKFWEPWQKFYMGICEGQGFRTEFEMVHLKKIHSQCRHLTGLLNLFKSKIETEMREPVSVSAKFGYTLQDWTNFTWSQEPPDIELFAADIGWSELSCLPFGAVCEPISTMTLHTCWPEVVETAMVDSETFSDFDPLTAPRWSLSISRADNPVCLLTDYLAEFLLFCTSKKTAEDLMGDFASRDTGGEMLQPFSLLTESRIPTLSNLLNQYASRKKSLEGPISQKLLMPILYYLFPDVEENSKYPYSSDCETEKGSGQRTKTCGVDSLVWRLALVMAHGLHMFGGAKAAAHIWHEFSQEVRFRWNSGNIIPGVAPGLPDPKTCLLHQKLQMINCCIERKQKREKAPLSQKDSEESEDEFFDCDEAVEEVRHAPWNTPVGRLRPHGSLRLINSGHPLYLPVTQGVTPKTEDEVEEDAQVLIQLGADAEGSQMRAKIMSASLLSDMESFKAANPGAVIEDFIRWYSPRDWVEEEGFDEYGQRKGKLSARMTLPGNTWLEVWEAAKPVPAARQKRLFDETREAEKALHFLEYQPPGSCATLVLPVLAHAAVSRLSDATKDIILHSLDSTVHQAVKRTEALTRHNGPVDIRRYQDLCQEIGQAETVASQVRSLEAKLGGDEAARVLAARLVSMPETELPDGPSGPVAARLKAMFTEAYKATLLTNDGDMSGGGGDRGGCVLPPASEKEFILRGWAPRPSRGARPSPHRLHARVTRHNLSMATAFSLDNTFF